MVPPITRKVHPLLVHAASQLPLGISDVGLLGLGVAVLLAAGIVARRVLDTIAGSDRSAVADGHARGAKLRVLAEAGPGRKPSEQA